MEGDFLNVEDLDEETIDAILGLGTADQRAQAMEQQLAQAQKLRHGNAPEGRGYGGVYTAASPIEHAVYAAEGIKAGRDIDKLQKEQMALLQEQTSGRKKFMEALMRQKSMQQPIPSYDDYGPQLGGPT